MQHRRAIASTVAVAGALISLTVAGIAIVNATDDDALTESATLVVDSEPLAAPSLEPQPLPGVTLPPLGTTQAPDDSTTETPNTTTAATSTVTRAEARALVLAEAPGEVVKTWAAVHNGYRAYAVKVLRPDGSLATGFVDRASGVVFDWTTVAAPQPANDAYDEDDHDEDHDDESHDEDDD